MKSDDNESCSKSTSNENTESKETAEKIQEPKPSSSNSFPNSPDAKSNANDSLFEPTVDMLVNDFDEEQTLEEEEALAAKEQQDPGQELSDLQRESEMSIEDLLKLYGCGPPVALGSGSSPRKRRRRSEKPNKKSPPDEESSSTLNATKVTATSSTAPAIEESEDDAATTTTNTTNNLENQSLDDETNYEDEEPSELKKLYTKIYEGVGKDGEIKLDATLSDEEEDLDYLPDEEDGKKTIMIGTDHQAFIPEGLLKYDDALPYENEDKLLWDPSKVNDQDIEDYLCKFSSATNGQSANHTSQTSGIKHLRDDEQALLLLVQCGNNCEEALRRRRLGAVQPTTNTMSIWSEEECRNFENGLRLFGKSFHEIQESKVKTRSVGELVEFYYLWKKTERADQFANKSRMEKKKYTLNPCVTDLMEKYLEEYDNSGSNRSERDRSVSPNVNNSNSILQSDTKRHPRSESSSGNNNQLSPDKLLSKQKEDSTAIKTE